MNKVLKKIWITTAILIITLAVFSSIFRSLTPWAKQYKGEVEQHLTHLLGQPVTIQSMETGWYWFQPVLKLSQVSLNNDNKTLQLDKLLVGINLFKSLIHWRIQPGLLYLDGLRLDVREHDGQWTIDGILSKGINNKVRAEDTQQILSWLSQQERFMIKNVSVYLHFSDGDLLPVSGLNLLIINKGGIYKIKGDARLEQTNATLFHLLGDLNFNPYHIAETNGQLFLAIKNLTPAQWQNSFSKKLVLMEGGKGDLSLWLDFNKGTISSAQAKVTIKRLAWHMPGHKNSQMIQQFHANLSWKPDIKGWQFQADHVALRTGGVLWPENQWSIRFDKSQQSYQFFMKSLVIESLLSQAIDWPAPIQKLIQMKAHGLLSDSQLFIKDQQINYVLTRFDHLSWAALDTIPQVENLSGALNWQPGEGRLELDSENTSIKVKGYPAQKFNLLNAAVDWKELSNGLRVSVERFVLSQPELTMSMQGSFDEVSASSLGAIHLVADFSAKNLQQWLALLPKKHLKEKLYHWLTIDIKQIAQASGKVTINGLAKDFPFDNKSGEFSIVSHLSGVNLFINSKWQIIKDIEAYLRVNSRNLDVDIVNADFQGVNVKQINLRIDDIGKDKENLLMHGIINASGQKILNYVWASPLKEKLGKLKMLSLKGLLLLNLRLEIPLYPENDDNLVKGDVNFKDNTVLVKGQVSEFAIDGVAGTLSFDENGVIHSALVGSVLGYPLKIAAQSVQTPKPVTNIAVNGECNAESLKNHFNLPVLAVLKGNILFNALFKLTNDPKEVDSLHLSSSLKGLAIDLPTPIGKKRDEEVPLEMYFDLNGQKELRLRASYHNRLSTDLLLQHNDGGLKLKSGEVRLGSATALDQHKAGLAVVGSLDGFDLQQWQALFAQYSSEENNSIFLRQLRLINVSLSKFSIFKQQFDNIIIKAKILPKNIWAFNLKQKKVSADLTYNITSNSLSGFVHYLHLAKIASGSAHSDAAQGLSPSQVPNLNLRIDNLSVGEVEVGNVTLKSQSTAEKWAIDYCRIESSVYQFNIEGNWVQKDKKNYSTMYLQLHLTDLGKSLERWHVNPAVDARKGDMEFRGGWKGAAYDFSLSALNGSMYLELKNGRITNLSPETEEKLGLGKLLSVLSLQTIPRRLQLDFSDLSHQGYSFDIFKGNFNIKQGIMNTQDSYMDGPVAYASMKGDLDLARQMYDLDLSISPHITASLPVVATIAGGPVVGIAAWVANKIINQSMQKISAYSYKISGPWKQPVVQQLSIVRKQTENLNRNR